MKLPQSTLTSLAPWWRRLLALAELAGDLEQKDIADRLGVRPAAVGAWKNRGLEPRSDRLRKATDELFGQLKDIAYPLDPSDSEEPNKGTRKRGT